MLDLKQLLGICLQPSSQIDGFVSNANEAVRQGRLADAEKLSRKSLNGCRTFQ